MANDTNHNTPTLTPDGTVPHLPTTDEFRDRVALVTGGTDGLGRHLCAALVSMGAHVFFCGRTAAKGDACAREWGGNAHFFQCDVADASRLEEFARHAGALRGGIDYVVNNAAIDQATPLGNITVEAFDHLAAVNLRAYLLVCQATAAFLRSGTGKAIVNVGTTNCMHGWSGMAAYNATKAGIIGLTRTLARELGPDGIRVNALSPGWVMTERQLRDVVSEGARRDLVATQCVKSLLTPQHVTPVTLFLLSKASSAVTGQNIVVDGGKLMQ